VLGRRGRLRRLFVLLFGDMRAAFGRPRANEAEVVLFDRPPQLSGIERRRVFDLPVAGWSAANDILSVSGKIGFLISAGYFRSARRFFLASDFHDHDIAYAAARLGIGTNGFDSCSCSASSAAVRDFIAESRSEFGDRILVGCVLKSQTYRKASRNDLA
jgi:hypothetical protein